MKSPYRRKTSLRDLCAELHQDDGVDPRTAFSRGGGAGERSHGRGDGRNDRKTHQLCKQAARSLAAALSGGCGDPRLRDLEIVGVEPAPDSTRLRVSVRPSAAADRAAPAELLACLNSARGMLRSQLAADITRKRVPELTFQIADENADACADVEEASEATLDAAPDAVQFSFLPAPPLPSTAQALPLPERSVPTTTSASPVRSWLCEPLPADVRLAIERLSRAPDVRHIAVMPDVHLAAAVCVGNVIATTRLIYPQAIGSDIGCGMAAIAFDRGADVLAKERIARNVLGELQSAVPILRHRNRESAPALPAALFDPDSGAIPLSTPGLANAALREGRIELGTLGRGNHFLEFQEDEDERLWLVLHSGSRHMGQAINAHHIRNAARTTGGLCHLDSADDAGRAYLADVAWACRFADANRRRMIAAACAVLQGVTGAKPLPDSFFTCDHNHVRHEQHDLASNAPDIEPSAEAPWFFVHRKGAISAREGEMGIIPGSMGTCSFHVMGRGEPNSLSSSSHGAGRRMSREAARRRVRPRDLHAQMRGVWFDDRLTEHLCEEAPAAYKDIEAVFRAQRGLTRIVRKLRPVLVYKGV